MTVERGLYNSSEDHAHVDRIRMTKDKKFLGIEIVKDHVFGDNAFKTIEVVIFKASLS